MARTHEIDNLRIALTILVIFHHASIPYGGLGSWPYKPLYPPGFSFSSLVIVPFNIMNQTFFMALFFLLSGYFSALASESRTRSTFLKEKWKRLGVPCIVYSILGPCIIEYIIATFQDNAPLKIAISRATLKLYSTKGPRGPVWYCAVLLLFDAIYVFTYYPLTSKPSPTQPSNAKPQNQPLTSSPRKSHLPTPLILTFLPLTSLTAFLLRTRFPLGTTLPPLNLELGFLPQYTLYYTTGIYTRSTLRTSLHCLVPRSSVRLPLYLDPLRCAIVVLLLLLYGALFIRAETVGEVLERGRGGWNLAAGWYVVFNEVMGFAMSVVILRWFGERKWVRGKWVVGGCEVGRWSYAAFLVHAPVVVGTQCFCEVWDSNGVVKGGVVGTVGTVGSWIVGWGLGRGLEGVGLRGYV